MYLSVSRPFQWGVVHLILGIGLIWALIYRFRPDLAFRLELWLSPKKLHPSVEDDKNRVLQRLDWLAGRSSPPEDDSLFLS